MMTGGAGVVINCPPLLAPRACLGVSVHPLASVTSGGHHGPFFIGVVVIVLVLGAVIVSRFRRR
jgi:hypothetical protein